MADRKTPLPVQIWADIITRLESYPGTPANTVSVEIHKTMIIPQMTIESLKSGTLSFGDKRLGFSHIEEVGTHLARVYIYLEMIMIIELGDDGPEMPSSGTSGFKSETSEEEVRGNLASNLTQATCIHTTPPTTRNHK